MAERRREDDRTEDLETRAGAEASGAAPAGGGAGGAADTFDDMVSLPRGRPVAPSSVPRRPAGGAAADAGGDADSGGDAATIAETPASETPTVDIDLRRADDAAAGAGSDTSTGSEDATVAPTAPSSEPAGAAPTAADDEGATLAEPNFEDRLRERSAAAGATPLRGPTRADPGAASRSAKSQGPVPASKFSRGTARDPIAGTGAGRGTTGAAASGLTQLREGDLLADRYELVRRLGKGGMGEVWQARHTLLQGMRAIKVIKASISRDPSFRARFLSEGQTMMRVKHPGVVEVTDLDETRRNHELFMVMDYLQGRTMHDAVRDLKAPLCADVREAVRIHAELADGMQVIHDARIVHKDLKTDNVILVRTEDGREHPKVIDFGLAKRMDDRDVPLDEGGGERAPGDPAVPHAVTSRAGASHDDTKTTLSGTLAYMAPEQFRGEPSSARSDLYAFGVMLYECFTKGDYPMPRGSLLDYLTRHRAGEVPKRLRQVRPDLDPVIAEIADRCMAPRLEDRPASFRDVAAELRWWLAAPERARRRNRALLTAGAAVLLVGIAIAGVLSGERTAALSGPRLRVGDRALEARDGRTWLAGPALGAVVFEAAIDGDADDPVLEIDGVRAPARFDVANGRYAAEFDLSDLADGRHELAFRASPDAAANRLLVEIDREPPRIAELGLLEGASSGASPGHTREQNPVVVVTVSEPQDRLLEVVTVRGPARSAESDPGDPRRWRLVGTADGDGETVVAVAAVDLAGNRSEPRELRYVRDTAAPTLVADGVSGRRFQVRRASGNVLRVRANEAVRLAATFRRGGVPVPHAGPPAAAQQFDVGVPDVPPEGLTAELVATDAAGNTTQLALDVAVVADTLAVVTKKGESRLATRGDADEVVEVRRSYPVGSSLRIARARLRDADGAPTDDAAVDFDDAIVRPTADPGVAELVLPRGLAPGEYAVSVLGTDEAHRTPLRLVVDPSRPVVGDPVVREAGGRAVPPGGWSLSPDLVVDVVVADLSLTSLTLNGTPPQADLAPGRATHRFRVRAEAQGATTWTLVAADAAGNRTEIPLTVQCDWEDPRLEVATPRPGDPLDNVTPTTFSGRCSEPDFDFVVSGLPGGELRGEHSQQEFADAWLLPDGEHTVTCHAVDRAGRRSAPVALHLVVAFRATELPDVVTWSRGVTSQMRKVPAGAVVLEQRTHPVEVVFLDRTEVTNRAYRAFLAACDAHAKASPGTRAAWDHPDQPAGWSHVPPAATWADPKWNADDLPVVNVAWWDAYAFAAWTGRRLPSEAEWVQGAAKSRDRAEIELRRWPPLAAAEPWRDGLLVTRELPGTSGPARADAGADESPWGLLHMGGNVSEWVDLPFAAKGDLRTGVRGGSWWMTRSAADVRVPTKRYDPSFRERTIGFRCAVGAESVRP